MRELKKLRDKYYWESRLQRSGAWKEKDFKKAIRIREKEKINYEKWKLLDGVIKVYEREEKK